MFWTLLLAIPAVVAAYYSCVITAKENETRWGRAPHYEQHHATADRIAQRKHHPIAATLALLLALLIVGGYQANAWVIAGSLLAAVAWGLALCDDGGERRRQSIEAEEKAAKEIARQQRSYF